jgi:hypothetical protein
MILKNFNGYAVFDYVKNPTLRTYNRINVYLNVKERHGNDVGKNYLKQFNRNEQLEIFSMLRQMAEIGYEQFRRNLIRERNAI